jgi:hypothetical protein
MKILIGYWISVKHFFNIPNKCRFTFYFITFLPRVSVCYIHHFQGESPNTCTKPSPFYSVVLYVGCVIGYKIHTFEGVLTMIETIFCSLVCTLKNL